MQFILAGNIRISRASAVFFFSPAVVGVFTNNNTGSKVFHPKIPLILVHAIIFYQ